MSTSEHAKSTCLRSQALNKHPIDMSFSKHSHSQHLRYDKIEKDLTAILQIISKMREKRTLDEPHAYQALRRSVFELQMQAENLLSPDYELTVSDPHHGIHMAVHEDQMFVRFTNERLIKIFQSVADDMGDWHPASKLWGYCDQIQKNLLSTIYNLDECEKFNAITDFFIPIDEHIQETRQACLKMIQTVASTQLISAVRRFNFQADVLRYYSIPIQYMGESFVIDRFLMEDSMMRIVWVKNELTFNMRTSNGISIILEAALRQLSESWITTQLTSHS